MDNPSPDKAPQRPAIVLNRQIEHKKPIQLKKNATVIKMLLFKDACSSLNYTNQ